MYFYIPTDMGIATCIAMLFFGIIENAYAFDLFEALLAAGTKSENALSEVANSAEDSEVKDMVADETLLESNGNDPEQCKRRSRMRMVVKLIKVHLVMSS